MNVVNLVESYLKSNFVLPTDVRWVSHHNYRQSCTYVGTWDEFIEVFSNVQVSNREKFVIVGDDWWITTEYSSFPDPALGYPYCEFHKKPIPPTERIPFKKAIKSSVMRP